HSSNTFRLLLFVSLFLQILPGTLYFLRQSLMQPLAVAHRQFERTVIRSQDQNISSRIQDRRTNFAVFQVPLDIFAHLGVDASVDIFRNAFPHVFAVELHRALPKNLLRAGTAVLRKGTNCFWSRMRARCNRTFTTPGFSPSASAVSSIFSSSRSLSVKTCL